MRIWLLGIFTLALSTAAFAEEPKNVFSSNELGISIDAPIAKNTDVQNYAVAIFFLPPSDNFAANVNVMRQKFSESINKYDRITTDQFKQSKLIVLSNTQRGNEFKYEYKGKMESMSMHWYARAIKSGEYVYLVTGSTLESKWEEQKSTIIHSVESFKVK